MQRLNFSYKAQTIKLRRTSIKEGILISVTIVNVLKFQFKIINGELLLVEDTTPDIEPEMMEIIQAYIENYMMGKKRDR
jgi:hypothetical protein